MKIAQHLDLLPFEAEEVVVAIGKKIQLARRARGWTQSDLAAKMGVGINMIVNLEKGSPSVAFGQVVMALWTLDSLGPLREAARTDLDPVIQQEALSRLTRSKRGSRG
ncbi:helix-turn-helix domain-containing protein [Paraburkholderia acidicola]|uniref:helix-turn-helix domain-containing protein n=1 Tax=Paraburkholderia acidicola TaxID=1912599 RepID=UPI001A976B13|nr:helix-turn-helix domain-containing protein [Paraburkholderia acidicola]